MASLNLLSFWAKWAYLKPWSGLWPSCQASRKAARAWGHSKRRFVDDAVLVEGLREVGGGSAEGLELIIREAEGGVEVAGFEEFGEFGFGGFGGQLLLEFSKFLGEAGDFGVLGLGVKCGGGAAGYAGLVEGFEDFALGGFQVLRCGGLFGVALLPGVEIDECEGEANDGEGKGGPGMVVEIVEEAPVAGEQARQDADDDREHGQQQADEGGDPFGGLAGHGGGIRLRGASVALVRFGGGTVRR